MMDLDAVKAWVGANKEATGLDNTDYDHGVSDGWQSAMKAAAVHIGALVAEVEALRSLVPHYEGMLEWFERRLPHLKDLPQDAPVVEKRRALEAARS
jgi:hypothetical protein